MREVVIVGAARTPIGSFQGELAALKAPELGKAAIAEALKRAGAAPGDVDGMIHDGLWDVYNNFHMGTAAELCAKEKKIDRAMQDAYAIESFKRALAAQKSGAFKDEIVAVEVAQRKGAAKRVELDEGP